MLRFIRWVVVAVGVSIASTVRQARCKQHGWRLMHISWDGEARYRCAHCGKRRLHCL
jgi:hypothetical protein